MVVNPLASRPNKGDTKSCAGPAPPLSARIGTPKNGKKKLAAIAAAPLSARIWPGAAQVPKLRYLSLGA